MATYMNYGCGYRVEYGFPVNSCKKCDVYGGICVKEDEFCFHKEVLKPIESEADDNE